MLIVLVVTLLFFLVCRIAKWSIAGGIVLGFVVGLCVMTGFYDSVQPSATTWQRTKSEEIIGLRLSGEAKPVSDNNASDYIPSVFYVYEIKSKYGHRYDKLEVTRNVVIFNDEERTSRLEKYEQISKFNKIPYYLWPIKKPIICKSIRWEFHVKPRLWRTD